MNRKAFTLIELLVVIAIIGILAGMLLPVLARAKAKVNRIKCVNNAGQIGKALQAFSSDNSGLMPWQLTPLRLSSYFGDKDPKCIASIVSLKSMKSELVTPKILWSPCDAEAQASNEDAQANWQTYDTLANRKIPCSAVSYRFIEGATQGRPGTLLVSTRNLSSGDLASSRWLGADEPQPADDAVTGLNKSQGNGAFADGSTRQMSDKDIGATGTVTRYHQASSGGTYKGPANTAVIGCCGGGSSTGGTIFVKANIDDDDILLVTPTFVQWDHRNAARPGKHGGNGLSNFKHTELDGFNWFPKWEHDDSRPQMSSQHKTTEYAKMLKAGTKIIIMEWKVSNFGGARVKPRIIGQPSEENGYTLKIHFLDKDGHGPELFEVLAGNEK